MLITGAAGIGKSLLWSDFAGSLPERWRTFQSDAHLAGPSLEHPFGRLVERVDPTLPPARAIGRDLARVLADAAAHGPVAVCIEDLHFLDPVAVMALTEAVDALGATPVLLFATSRLGTHAANSPWANALTATTAHPSVVEKRLPPLGREAVTSFLREVHGVDDPARVAELHRRSQGLPLAVVELADAHGEGGEDGDIHEMLAAKVQRLSAPARRTAQLLAVAARPVATAILEKLGHASGGASLLDRGLAVTTVDGAVTLRHALVAEVVLRASSGNTVRRHHLSLAHALAGLDEPPTALIATHFAGAGRVSDAARWAGPAADRSHARGAHYSALRLYEIALADPQLSERERLAYLGRASTSASVAGEGVQTAVLAAKAQYLRTSIDGRDRAAQPWVNALTLDVTADEGGAPSPASAILEAANVAVEQGDLVSARTLARDAFDRALDTGDGSARATAALVGFYAGDFQRGREGLEALHHECIEVGDAPLGARTLAHLARLAWARGDIARSVQYDREASTLARSSPGDVWAHYQLGVAYQLARCGELDEAERLVKEVVVLEDPIVTGMAQLPLAMIEFERGDVESCRARLDPLVGMARAVGLDQLTALLLIVVAAVETAEGDAATGVELAVEVDGLAHSPYHELQADRHLILAAAAERVDPARLEQTVRTMDDLVRVMPGDHIFGCAEAVRGIRGRRDEDHDEALARFTSAAEAFERAGQWVAAAERWYDAAEQHLALGHSPDRVVERAQGLVAEHGLVRVGRRAERIAVGADTRVCAPSILDELTGRELDILRLVGMGLTNKEIAHRLYLSKNTVRNNLVSVFAKLGVRRRGEAVGVALRAGLVD